MPEEERKFCPLMFGSPELWDWDDESHTFTRPYCLESRCALWDGTRCALKAVAANTKPVITRFQMK